MAFLANGMPLNPLNLCADLGTPEKAHYFCGKNRLLRVKRRASSPHLERGIAITDGITADFQK